MTENKKITMWIERSDEDAAFIGYCPIAPNSFRTAPFATAALRQEQSPSLLQLCGMNWANKLFDALAGVEVKSLYMIPQGGTFNTHRSPAPYTSRRFVFGKLVGFEELQLPQHSSN